MSTNQTAFRLPEELLERIDAYAAYLTVQHGIHVTRADSARLLLAAGLVALEVRPKRKRKRKKKAS